MKYYFVTALLDFDVREKILSPIDLSDGLYLTNDSSLIGKHLLPEQALSIGTLEMNCLLNGNPVLFMEKDVPTKKAAQDETVNFLRASLGFLAALWMEKDNSVNFELGFSFSKENGHIHSNSLSYHFWSHQGDKKKTKIGLMELASIARTCREYFGVLTVDNEPEFTYQRRELGRINNSVIFLQQARSTPDLAIKISNYCSFFECLLSSNNVELAHQMSERAAFLLVSDPEKRLEHYGMSKSAYSIRSKVVHGDSFSEAQLKRVRDLSVHCDQLARDLMRKIMSDDQYRDALLNRDSQVLDTYMLNRIFGVQ